jgi:hypothetical protein
MADWENVWRLRALLPDLYTGILRHSSAPRIWPAVLFDYSFSINSRWARLSVSLALASGVYICDPFLAHIMYPKS